PDITELRIEVVAAGLDFEERWHSVRVEIECAGEHALLELDGSCRTAVTVLTPVTVSPQVRAKLTYLSRQGQTIELTVDRDGEGCIVVGDPFDGCRRRIAVVPAGVGWNDIAQ